MYLSGVPFEQIGFRTDLGTEPIPGLSKMFLTVASPMYIVFPALALGIYSFSKRRDAIAKEDLDRARQEKEGK
jgi:formate dehydrogenase iron-sulfur subunit